MTDIDNWLTSRETAELLGVKRDTVWRIAARGELTKLHLASNYLLIADDEKLAAAKIKAAAGGFKRGGGKGGCKERDPFAEEWERKKRGGQ